MTAREIITARLNHQGTDVTPYTLDVEPQLYARLNDYYGDGWYDRMCRRFMAKYLYVDTVQMRQKDDAYSIDGYGALWDMSKKPWHLAVPPFAEPSFDGVSFPSAEVFVNPILEAKPKAIELYAADTEHFRVIDMGWGIFEHSWRCRGFENALMDMLLDEDFYAELTNKITDIYIEIIKACADIPAEAFHFGDDWGDQRGLIMGAKSWRKYFKPCWARIYAEVHKQGRFVLQHSCGSIAEVYDDLAEIGMNCHESVQPEAAGMRPDEIKAKYGKKMAFWGCLGSQSTLHNGTPAEVKAEILRLRDLFKDDGGYILAPAKPLVDDTPLDRARAVVETFAELNG